MFPRSYDIGECRSYMPVNTDLPLSTLLSQALVAYTIELDNEFEHRFALAVAGRGLSRS